MDNSVAKVTLEITSAQFDKISGEKHYFTNKIKRIKVNKCRTKCKIIYIALCIVFVLLHS